MPTYDYRCNACDHEFELFQSMSASSKRKCPECGKLKLERLIGTGAAVIFKGSGFYETDYRSEGYKKAAQAEKDSGKKAETDAKPAKADDKKSGGDPTKPGPKADAKPGKASDSKPDKKG
ncbi:MAG: putative FmdB family regulatory protein [Phycisphaerales bacterium]|jgi:putative FmdB family regulatory protein